MSIVQPIIQPTTAAVVTQVTLATKGHYGVVIAADNLAGAEEVDIYVRVNNSWILYTDEATGTAIKLTATSAHKTVRGGPEYGILKDATAGACGVFWGPLNRVY